jgi:copper chaperone CopZ
MPSPSQAPTPAPVAKTPAPEQPAAFSGSVRIMAYSDSITTGESAKIASSIDFDKIQAALKRVAGVTDATFDASSRTINVQYGGPWKELNKLSMAVNNNGVSAELLSPARVGFRPMVQIDDEGKVLGAVKGISGVQYVSRENGDIQIYCDLSTTSLDSIRSACESAGVKGMIVTHEEIQVKFSAGQGNGGALVDDVAKTKWVLKAEVVGDAVKVLAVRGRVTKALIKSLLSKHGFAEAK